LFANKENTKREFMYIPVTSIELVCQSQVTTRKKRGVAERARIKIR
jgi:hypothetical protein